MPNFADTLRRFWLPRLNEISGKPSLPDVRAWIGRQKFQAYSPIKYPFQLTYSDQDLICQAIAGETVRMSTAALESIVSIQPVANLPRSKAWAAIQWYYAAFYSAHALLRMFGQSLVQLDAGQARDINQVASLFGQAGSASAGFHLIEIISVSKTVVFSKMDGSGGSHEFMWRSFERWLDIKSKELLKTSGSIIEIQDVVTRLDDLRAILNTPPAPVGSWLSHVRNLVNYKHDLATWHPYLGHNDRDLCLFSYAVPPPSKADSIRLSPPMRPLERFLAACRFIVALCLETSAEMSLRCPTNDSFHNKGVLHLEKLLQQSRSATSKKAGR